MRLNKESILQRCKKNNDKYDFLDSVIPKEGMVLAGEILLFSAICDLYKVECIIESGLYHGISTKMLADYFTNKKIISIDIDILPETRKLFENYENVTLIEGDGATEVPNAILEAKEKGLNRLAVFIDGPKGKSQISLAKNILQDVEFVAMHDLGKTFSAGMKDITNSNEYEELNKHFLGNYILSTESWYKDKFSFLNLEQMRWLQNSSDHRWENRNDGYDQALWNPILESITPEGFGLAAVSKYGVDI